LQAILLDPDNVSLLKEKAATLQRLKRLDEARETYKKIRILSNGSSLIEMGIESVDAQKGFIVLKDAKLNRHLHIRITNAEAEAFRTDNPSQEAIYRPLPRLYNLVKNIIEGFGASITMIIISEMVEETFYATIILKIIDKQMQYDSHAIDAIALATQMKVPIFVEEDIVERAKDIKEVEPTNQPIELTPLLRSAINRFDNFTEQAKKVLSLAQEEAQRFQHNFIGTEHLLLGLIRGGEGVAIKVLQNLGVEPNKVRAATEFIIGRGDRIVLGEIGLTPRAKKVIELAVDEARRLNHHYIGTEHLLLGLVREGEGIAAGVLESLGVKLDKARTQTIQVLIQSGAQQVSPLPVISPVSSPPVISPELQSALHALESVLREKEAAIKQQEYELAAELRDREVKLRDHISKLEKT
jgi:bifunctional DNase/RNase